MPSTHTHTYICILYTINDLFVTPKKCYYFVWPFLNKNNKSENTIFQFCPHIFFKMLGCYTVNTKLNLINGLVTRLSDPTIQTHSKYIGGGPRFSGLLMFTSLHVLTSVYFVCLLLYLCVNIDICVM